MSKEDFDDFVRTRCESEKRANNNPNWPTTVPSCVGDAAWSSGVVMTEIRCVKCNRLLMRGDVKIVEIKCPKCGFVMTVRASLPGSGGKLFNQKP